MDSFRKKRERTKNNLPSFLSSVQFLLFLFCSLFPSSAQLHLEFLGVSGFVNVPFVVEMIEDICGREEISMGRGGTPNSQYSKMNHHLLFQFLNAVFIFGDMNYFHSNTHSLKEVPSFRYLFVCWGVELK